MVNRTTPPAASRSLASSPTRRRAIASAVALPAVALAACSQGAAPEGGATTATPVTITMWHIWDTTRVEPFHKSLQMLTEKRPTILVDPQPMATGSDRDREQKITAVIATGDPPDPLMVNQGVFADLAGANSIVPLDDLLAKDKIKRLVASLLEEVGTPSDRARKSQATMPWRGSAWPC